MCLMMDSGGFNNFNNDGSFMENFRKLQQEKKSESAPESKPKPKPLPPIRKPLVMKMAKLKKPPVLVKPAATVAALEGKPPVDNEQDRKGDVSRKEPDIPMAISIGLTEPDIPMAISIGLASCSGISPISREPIVSDTQQAPGSSTEAQLAGRKRRRNRWSDAVTADSASKPTADTAITAAMASLNENATTTIGGSGGQNLTPEQLWQVQEQIEMNKLVAEIRCSMERALQKKKKQDPSQPVFEYDSDEEVDGGTWEHKKRSQEMMSTLEKAVSLTEMSKGKHHIGDFLPPKELEKFIEKAKAIKEGRNPDFSDYKEHKLSESNVGFKLLQKSGWAEGEGLGEKGDGIIDPINQGKTSFDQAGVGAEIPGEVTNEDDPFDTYRKRMMLAYRFRPNPLNNPRRSYY